MERGEEDIWRMENGENWRVVRKTNGKGREEQTIDADERRQAATKYARGHEREGTG